MKTPFSSMKRIARSKPPGSYGTAVRLFSSRRCRSASERVSGSCAVADATPATTIHMGHALRQLPDAEGARCATTPHLSVERYRKEPAFKKPIAAVTRKRFVHRSLWAPSFSTGASGMQTHMQERRQIGDF